MCGRYGLDGKRLDLEAAFSAQLLVDVQPRYNIAPTTPILVIKDSPQGRIGTFHLWGLVPSWAKDPVIGAKMINARSETAAEKPSFRNALKRRRCIIPASGFYEWQALGKGQKQPYWIHRCDGDFLAFAGLWESWQGPNGEELDTCTILTTTLKQFLLATKDAFPGLSALSGAPNAGKTARKAGPGGDSKVEGGAAKKDDPKKEEPPADDKVTATATATLLTGPAEHFFLAAELPVNTVNLKTQTGTPKEAPKEFLLGFYIAPWGDALDQSWDPRRWQKMIVVKGSIKASSTPLTTSTLGIGLRVPKFREGTFFNFLSGLVFTWSRRWVENERTLPGGGTEKYHRRDNVVQVAYDLSSVKDWFKK